MFPSHDRGRSFRRTWVDYSNRPTTRLQKKYQLDNPELGTNIEDLQGTNSEENEQILYMVDTYSNKQQYIKDLKKDLGAGDLSLKTAKDKFEELTGLKATRANIKKVLATKEGAAQQRAETAIFEAERLQEEKGVRQQIESEVEKRTPKKEEPKGDIKPFLCFLSNFTPSIVTGKHY